MRAISEHFAEYGAHHTGRGNRACHLIGLPMIGAGTAGLLSRVPLAGGADAGMAFLVLLVAFYLWAAWRLALPIAVLAPLLYLAGAVLSLPAQIAVFLVGNAIPLAGHLLLEKAGPASLGEGISGLFLGPLWFVDVTLRRR